MKSAYTHSMAMCVSHAVAMQYGRDLVCSHCNLYLLTATMISIIYSSRQIHEVLSLIFLDKENKTSSS